MKNILLTTDFSDNANEAIEYAMQLFKYDECKFYVLHVLKASTFISDDLMSMKPTSNLYEQLIVSAKLKLEKHIETVNVNHGNILHEFIPIVDYDNLVAAVNQQIEKHDIQLIVMGTKGASNLAKKLIGSNTMHVIQRCDAPVLAIPEKCEYKPIHKVVFTSNYETVYCSEDLKTLVKLVEHHDYKIDVLHISDSEALTIDREKVKESLKDCFKNATYKFVELKKGGFLKALTGHIQSNSIDLFAMVSRKRSFWDRLFTEQKIEKVAYNITIPFLVM